MAAVSGLDSRVSNNDSRERMMLPERASAVHFEYRIEPKVYTRDEWEWPANTPYPSQEETILAWLRSNDLHNEANAIDDIISLTSFDEDEPSHCHQPPSVSRTGLHPGDSRPRVSDPADACRRR